MITVTVGKPPDGGKLGISLEEDRHGGALVSRISSQGIFADTILRVGMEIVTVNSVAVAGLGIKKISQLMAQAEGALTLQAVAPAVPGEHPSMEAQAVGAKGAVEVFLDAAVVTVVVPHDPKLGLRLQSTPDLKHVTIRHMEATSIFQETELREGMRILVVNDFECAGLNVQEVSNLFRHKRKDGLLTVMAVMDIAGTTHDTVANAMFPSPEATPADLQQRFQQYKEVRSSQRRKQSPQPHIVRAMAFKNDPRQSTGLRLKETADRRFVQIDKIAPISLFSSSAIGEGMKILNINGVDCQGLPIKEVASLFRESIGSITVEAKR
jgi:predicted metalloprotease with PDZ domain